MIRSAKTRALITCCFLAGCFTVFSVRLVHLQVTMHEEYAAKAAEKHVNKQVAYARRGIIQDINGELLAQNEPVKVAIADGSMIEDFEAVADVLAGRLELERGALLEKLKSEYKPEGGEAKLPVRYIVLKKKVPESVALEIKGELMTKKLRGIYFEQASERLYPNGQMLCHVLGYVNSTGTGVEGIERALDRYLRGHDGYRYIERDRTGREIVPYRGQERSARDGYSVRLTVDMGLQSIVEDELASAVKLYNPKMASIVLMRPQTGEILALANYPNFDLNNQELAKEADRKNRAIMDMVEPGSTFKIVTVAAALTEKLVRPDTEIFCENGYFSWCKLNDHHGYGSLTVNDILVKSSNIGVAKLAMQLGDRKFYEYVRRFGFGERTGINLPGEIGGLVHPPHNWSKISITRIPMGHEVGATPLQVTTAMAAIANGGKLMLPQIVREITDEAGNVVAQFPPQEVRRVASQEATEAVREALIQVVGPKGTAALAQVPGYLVAGKTGTSQKLNAEGRYSKKYVASFVGYMPANDPAFVALVLFDEAQPKTGSGYGGQVAGPVFANIGIRAARYLNLPPMPEPVAPVTTSLVNMSTSQTTALRAAAR
ncbi:MAG TPA: penicillin-binding protein 2 [Chthoniobacteraceae bacterium]